MGLKTPFKDWQITTCRLMYKTKYESFQKLTFSRPSSQLLTSSCHASIESGWWPEAMLITSVWKISVDTGPQRQHEMKTREKAQSSLPKEFPHLPAMCQFCGDMFLELDRIIELLTTRIKDLGEVIRGSKSTGQYSWRWEQFEKDLRGNQMLTKASVLKTLDFYEGFGVSGNQDIVPPIVESDDVKSEAEWTQEWDAFGDINDEEEVKPEINQGDDDLDINEIGNVQITISETPATDSIHLEELPKPAAGQSSTRKRKTKASGQVAGLKRKPGRKRKHPLQANGFIPILHENISKAKIESRFSI